VIDVAVLPLTIGLAYRLRHDPAFRAALFAAVCYVLAFALWLAFVNPANSQMKAWSLDSPPETWATARDRWEYTHLARFMIQLAGFSALVLATLRRGSRPVNRIG
jgi:hypothetical protein